MVRSFRPLPRKLEIESLKVGQVIPGLTGGEYLQRDRTRSGRKDGLTQSGSQLGSRDPFYFGFS